MPEETISCNLNEFKEQVQKYESLALLVVNEASEAAESFAENLAKSEFELDTAVLVAEGKCKDLVDFLNVKETPSIVVLSKGVKKGEVIISGDFEADMEKLKKLCKGG